MLNSISECNKELSKIDSEIERLNLERNHILAVRDLLKKQSEKHFETIQISEPAILQPEKVILLDIIQENPGITGAQIYDILGITEHKEKRRTTMRLSDLRKYGRIENRGNRGMAARWYIRET